MKNLLALFATIGLLLWCVPGFAVNAPMIEQCDGYERVIYDVENRIKASDSTRMSWLDDYVSYIGAIDDYEKNSRFLMCTDQDGNASLKFNTPEEELRDKIKGLLAFVGWYGGVAGKLGTEAVSSVMLTKLKDNLEKVEGRISDYKTKGLTRSGNVHWIGKEYETLRQQREDTLSQLNRMTDSVLCYGLTEDEFELARIYHEEIPGNGACNSLQKVHLRSRIKQIGTFGFGAVFEQSTYDNLKSVCKNKSFVLVPDLNGLTLAEAKKQLTGLDLTLVPQLGKRAQQASSAGMIYEQSIEPGTRVRRWGQIEVQVFGRVQNEPVATKKVHICQDSTIPVDGSLLTYARIYGGGHTSTPVKQHYICYGKSYSVIKGRAVEHYICKDPDFTDCSYDSTLMADKVKPLDNGAYQLIFDGGKSWWNIHKQ